MSLPEEVGEIVKVGNQARDRRLDALDAKLIAGYRTAWEQVADELEKAVEGVINSAPDGQSIPAWRFGRSVRLAQALAKLQAELETLFKEYGQTLDKELPELVNDVLDLQTKAAQAQLPETTLPGAPAIDFNQVDEETVLSISQRAMERITAAHLPLPAEVDALMKQHLIRGVATGDNPKTVARKIIKDAKGNFFRGLPRATMIARTEMLDAGRESTQAWEKQNSDVVQGWVWVCALDARSCRSCVAMHGSVHDLDEPGPLDHHQGRCTRVVQAKPWEQLGFKGVKDTRPVIQTGEDFYNNLTSDGRQKLMGKRTAELLDSGAISFSDLTHIRKTKGWRDAYHQTSLTDLETIANASS